MADLRDPNVALQFLVGRATGHRVPAPQMEGVQIGYVLDNDETNPIICPPGTCRLVIPSYSAASVFGPVAYPGTQSPPGGGIPGPNSAGGTQCTVAFVAPQINSPSAAIAQIINFIGWPDTVAQTLYALLLSLYMAS